MKHRAGVSKKNEPISSPISCEFMRIPFERIVLISSIRGSRNSFTNGFESPAQIPITIGATAGNYVTNL